MRLLALARAPVELAEAEVAVGDEGAHATRLGERQRLAVVGLAALGIEPVGMGRDIAEQAQSMGCDPRLTRGGFDCAVAQAPRLVELAEQQSGPTQHLVGPPDEAEVSPRPVAPGELLALAEPRQRLARVAELREGPRGGGDRGGKSEDGISRPLGRDPVLDQ